MLFKIKRPTEGVMRPRVTPDPGRAAELERRINSVAYCPENGFLRDRVQDRIECSALRRMTAQASIAG